MKAPKINGAEALLCTILREKTNIIFGYPGGTIIPIYDSLYRYKEKIEHILVRHEQGAVHAAQGYSRSTGKIGVCMATAGPGATNFVTGIADAMMDSTPIICITAQVNADKLGTNFFQEADMIGITIPITKWSYQITKADEIDEIMQRAFKIAISGRPGPVLISLTKNAQTELTNIPKPKTETNKTNKFPCNHKLTSQAVQMLNNAKRPLIIAGHGVLISKGWKELEQCAKSGNIPVALTLLGLGALPYDNKYNIGMVGMHGNIAPNSLTQEADVILAVGMRFSDRVTGEVSGYAPKAKIIHIDIDEAEFDKNIQACLKINGDAKTILFAIAKKLKFCDRTEWFNLAAELKAKELKIITEPELACSHGLTMPAVIEALNNHEGRDQIVVTDVGQNQMFSARYIKHKAQMHWITSGGLGTMGFGLPAAIGAKAAHPQSSVVLITGDGGLQMNIQEFGTMLQNRIAIKIILLNNNYLGMVRQWQELFYDKRYSCTHLVNPDFEKICSAYNMQYRLIKSLTEANKAMEEMQQSNKSFLIEAAIENEENVFPMIPAGATLNNIIYNK